VNHDIAGRVAVVGGSSSGLGYAVAERLARRGVRVVVVSRSEDRVRDAVEKIRAAGDHEVAGTAVDLTEPDGPERVLQSARETFGEPTIVVANAGGPPAMPATDADAATLEAACALLLLPVQRLMRGSLPAMRQAGWGRFVAITSIAVFEPQPGLVLSNALRAAVTGYLKSVSDEMANEGITVNTVCPGFTATERLQDLARTVAEQTGTTVERVVEDWTDRVPARRLLQPDEVAAAVEFLCSDDASGVTGVALRVDGGLHRGLL
jgi:3-oxoacyl-[acyl-carrier protein] reductase